MKKIKVLLIYPPVRLNAPARIPPTGLMYMASVLRNEGVDIEILDVNLERWLMKDVVEYISKNKLDFLEGNIVKYISRHRKKNGAEDIRKVIHYAELILELEYGEN